MNTAKNEWEQQWRAPWTGFEPLAPLLALGLAVVIAWL